jgi:hypothetical protein
MTAAVPILRPLSLGELLDQAIRLYRHNFFKFVGIIALVSVPTSLVTLLVTAGGLFLIGDQMALNPGDMGVMMTYFGWVGSLLVTGTVSFVLIQGFGMAALTRSVVDSRLGLETGVLSSYQHIKSCWGQILLAVILALLVNMLLFSWLMIPCLGWVSGPVLFIFWTSVLWPLVIPILVIEQKNPLTAIRRAWDLARRRFWWVLGFITVLYLLSMLAIYGPASLASYLTQLAVGSRMDYFEAQQLSTIIQTIVSSLTSLVTIPIQLTATILMYFDLRVRTEGLDLALQTSNREGMALNELIAAAPAASSETLITRREAWYFGALMLIFGLVAIIILGGFMLLIAQMMRMF